MDGISAIDGKRLSGVDHLRQSVRDVLTTPIGTRIVRREYGSRLFELVDAALNRATVMDIKAATVGALARWEPRIKVTSVVVNAATPGAISLDVVGKYLPDGQDVTIDGIQVS